MACFVCSDDQSSFLFGFAKSGIVVIQKLILLFTGNKSSILSVDQVHGRILLMAQTLGYKLDTNVLGSVVNVRLYQFT